MRFAYWGPNETDEDIWKLLNDGKSPIDGPLDFTWNNIDDKAHPEPDPKPEPNPQPEPEPNPEPIPNPKPKNHPSNQKGNNGKGKKK
jgi:outer membrane biosynthesis protein TonB